MSTAPLSEEQWLHIKEAWRIFDTDGDGLITPSDLRLLLQSFGYEHSEEELGVYLDDLPLCLEKDRSLDMPEFVLWVLKLGEKIDIEELDELLDDEQDVEDSIPREATHHALILKEKLLTMRQNRQDLQDIVEQERIALDTAAFKMLDKEGNGYLTYQDMENLTRELEEPWTYKEVDAMMTAVTETGAARRVDLEHFRTVMRATVAWDEPDLYPCQQKLLEAQAAQRRVDDERTGKAKKGEEEEDEVVGHSDLDGSKERRRRPRKPKASAASCMVM